MLTTIFYVAVIWVTFKLLILGIKITMGFIKAFLAVLFFPVVVIGLFLAGAVYVAVIVLVIFGLISLLGNVATAD